MARLAEADLVEDVEWMAATGECFWMAATRLQMRPDTLERRLLRAGRYDLVTALRERQYAATQPREFHTF